MYPPEQQKESFEMLAGLVLSRVSYLSRKFF